MEDDHDEPVRAASRIKGYRGEESLVLSRTMIHQVIKDRKSFLASDSGDQASLDGMMSMVSQGIRSAIAVPLFDNEDVIGILYADDSRPQRTFSRDQLAAFTLLANTIAVALTHARYHELEEEKRRQDAELATASDILDNILPGSLPDLEGYDVLANLVPCFEVGGDLYFARQQSDGRYAFLVGDVTGKGLGAALLVSHIMSLTRFMLHDNWDPDRLVENLSHQTFHCTDFVRFATFFVGYLEPDTGKITYVNAGHNPPYVVRASGEVEECPTNGLPVGMMEGSSYTKGELTLGSGDMLAMFSDGIPETQTLDDDEYGEERFQELLVEKRDLPLQKIFDELQQELADFRGKAPLGDDVTLVTIRRQ
jgi:serine phosphatase RsbU (regulator of sigma subunit)